MKKTFSKLKSAFTLIEVILYIALVSIFISGAILFTWDVLYGRVKSSIEQEVNYNLRYISKRIQYEIRNASGINSVSSNSISLSSDETGRDPTVIDLSGGRIRIGFGTTGNCPSTSPCPISSSALTASSLSFTDRSTTGTTNIEFSLTLESVQDRSEWDYSESYTSSVELRTSN